MSDRYLERMRRAADEGAARGYEAVVVPPSRDLAYLTGYDPMPFERPTLLVLRHDRDPVMLVPALEEPLAAGSPAGRLVTLHAWRDGIDPYAEAARLMPAAGTVAVGATLWASHLLALQAGIDDVRFVSASDVLGTLRARKDPDELAALRRAGRGADETFRRICKTPFLGRREEEIAQELAALLLEHGHESAAFTIVASGPNGASPHHEPGGRTIMPRDAVVLDFGGELGGYFSDTSRTVVVGEPPKEFDRVYEVVREAQVAAVDAVRPGIAIQEIDRVARTMIEEAGFGEAFLHRTGHGIGLEVHEPPYAVEGDETVLEPGMTFSVEPGIYLAGRFGVRIEDIVAVTDEGVERLNRSTRDLQVVR
jgi:Xaa-Pro aminopeptidase